jgi:O-antigen ligase/polysaccharide polymerase Wzy-like membrane protein
MSYRTLEGARENGEQRSIFWLLALFVLMGFAISMALSFFAGASEYGGLLVAGVIVAAIPGIALLIKAFPTAVANAKLLARDWTWWHPLWFCIYFSTLVFRIRDVGSGQGNLVDSWALLRILPEGFVSVALITRLILKKPNWLGSLFRGIPCALTIYCLVSIASSAWSVNAAWTAYKSLEFLADVSLLAAVVASAEGFFSYESLVNWTLTFYGLSLVGVWINLPIWPTDAMDGDRLTGVFPVEASNSVGTSGAVLAIVAFCRLMPAFGRAKNRAWYILLFIFGIVSMVLSKTRNAEAAFLFGVGVVVIFSPPLRKKAIWVALALAPILAVLVFMNHDLPKSAYDAGMSVVNRDQAEGAIDTLSGRTGWWEFGLQQLSHHPLTGMGAYAAGRFAVLGKLGVGSASMMHSDWIEVVIGTSFWGLIPFAAALILTWWYLFRCIRNPIFTPEQRQLAIELFALLGLLTLHSFFNDELAWHCPLLYFAILAYAEFIRTYPKIVLQPSLQLRRLGPEDIFVEQRSTASVFHKL